MSKIEDLDEKYKRLTQRRDLLQKDKNRIEAELEARRRNLKTQMEAAKKEGFNPDNLKEDNFEAELDEAERVMRPMLDEIKA
jgi:predicted  nucleic acid-binding Zn-ribbon protein